MQVEMRTMITGNKSPDKMPVKIKQQGFVPVNTVDGKGIINVKQFPQDYQTTGSARQQKYLHQ